MSIRPYTSRGGFTILEVLLATSVVALIVATLVPSLIGSLRAERAAHALLDGLADEQAMLAQLRHDLSAAPRAVGTVAQPFICAATADSAGTPSSGNGGENASGSSLQVFTNLAPVLHSAVAYREAGLGQGVVTWRAETVPGSGDAATPTWRVLRSMESNLLAVGTAPAAVSEVFLDNVATFKFEVRSGTETWIGDWSSADHDGSLPSVVRVTWALRHADGSSGPTRMAIIGLPLTQLDPLQQVNSP